MAFLKSLFVTALLVASASSQCDTVADRAAAVSYITDSPTPTMTPHVRQSGDDSTVLDFIFEAPDMVNECYYNDVEIYAQYSHDGTPAGLPQTNYDNTGFTFTITFADSLLDNGCTASNVTGSVKYDCTFHFHAHYLNDFVMDWSFDLSLILNNGTVLSLSVETDQATIEGDSVDLPLEGNFAGSFDGTGSNVGPYIVGDNVYPKVSPPSDLAGQVEGTFTSIKFIDTDASSTEYEMLSLTPNTQTLADGSLIAEIPLLFVTEGNQATIALTVEWSLPSGGRILTDAANITTYSFEIEFKPVEGNESNESDDESSDNSSSDNTILYLIAAVSVAALLTAFAFGARYISKKKAQETKGEPVPIVEGTELNKV